MSLKPDTLGRIGGYRLVSVVDERGLLATYAAVDEALDRKALVRANAPNVSPSPRLIEALESEARTLAKLRHPGVVMLHEVVREGERVALCLEHPGGPTLDELIDTLQTRGGASAEEASLVLLTLARTVAHLHARGLVHANISPRSIYVSGERGVVLTGFDRAHEVADAKEAPRIGLDSAYLSPEELMDEAVTLGSDVFALGVVGYELLAGKRPFAAVENQDAEDGETSHGGALHRVRTERPASIASARRVPIDVERAVLRALSKQPGLRQANAGELVRDLESALGGERMANRSIDAMLGRAGLGPKPKAGSPHLDIATPEEEPSGRRVRDVVIKLGAVFLAMVALMVAIEVVERAQRPAEARATSNASPGYVRVLAHPWAEVWIDGVATDTTPLARPIELPAGRHTLVFKHPRASDERRVVDLGSGQVVTVAVDMHIVAPPIDAGVDASP